MKRLSLFVLFALCFSPFTNHAEAAGFRPFGGFFAGMTSGGSGVGTSDAHVAPIIGSVADISVEEEFIRMVNEVRIKAKMRPLQIDPDLSSKARGWAKYTQSFWAHKRGESEIITRGGATAQYAFSSWRGSAPHWNMLMRPDFTHIGIGRNGSHWCGRFRK